MNNFVVSAIKYRPQKFSEVIGQNHISETLKNAIKNNKLSHSYLFCGSYGTGKTTTARIFAKAINCTNLIGGESCNQCESCKNNSLNIFELDAASNNSVEHIKDLIQKTRITPQNGKYKVFIIDEVHMLSIQAYNSFLKTLEEPPKHCIFILATTEKHKIIQTILSRCQIFDFKRIRVKDIVYQLENICKKENIIADTTALNIIAEKSNGALRDALFTLDRIISSSANNSVTYQNTIDSLNVLDSDYYFKLTDSLLCEDLISSLKIYNEIINNGFDSKLFLSGLGEHLRNLLLCKNIETLGLLDVSDNYKTKYTQQSTLSIASFILTALNFCNDCDVNYSVVYNKQLHVEMMLIKICYISKALTLNQNIF